MVENAVKYEKIKEIQLDREVFEVAAYVTPPENTAKGVIQGIPERNTDQADPCFSRIRQIFLVCTFNVYLVLTTLV